MFTWSVYTTSTDLYVWQSTFKFNHVLETIGPESVTAAGKMRISCSINLLSRLCLSCLHDWLRISIFVTANRRYWGDWNNYWSEHKTVYCISKLYAVIQSSQWTQTFVWMIRFSISHVLCTEQQQQEGNSAVVSSAFPREEVMSVTEAQCSKWDIQSLDIKSAEAQNYTSPMLWTCVCPRMRVHTHVVLCMCFCGLTAIAPGLINILVSHEDLGAYGQWRGRFERERSMRSDRLCEHDSDWSLSATPSHLSSRLITCKNKRQAAHDEHNAMCRMKASTGLWSLLGTSFMFGSKLLRDFDDIPRTIGESLCSHLWSNALPFAIVCLVKVSLLSDILLKRGELYFSFLEHNLMLDLEQTSIPNLKYKNHLGYC